MMQVLECYNIATNSMAASGHIQQNGGKKSTMTITTAILHYSKSILV